eukprot:gene13933-15385_t
MKDQINSNPCGLEVEEQIKLSGHKWHVSTIAFSTNGVYFASGSWDKQVKVWDLRVLTTSTQVGNQSNCHEAPVTTISWFPNVEFLLASGSADNSVRIWNSESGDRLSVLREHSGWILDSTFNSSGSVLATSSWDKTIGIWDISTLKLSQSLQGHTDGVWGCAFRSAYGEDGVLCSASEDSSLKIWDLRADGHWHSASNLVGAHDDAIRCCAWSSCGNYVAAGSADSKISVWDIRENRVLTILSGHSDMVTDVKFLPFEAIPEFPVLASVGGTICKFWCPFASRNSKELCSLKQHNLDYEVECLGLSPDGTLIATGGRDNNVVLSTINISEEIFEPWSIKEKLARSTNQLHHGVSRKFDAQGGSKLTRKVSAKSSALIVDDAVHQNEVAESEKAKKIAKQTVKMKSTGTSDVLQSKILEMKLQHKTTPPPHQQATPPPHQQKTGEVTPSQKQQTKNETTHAHRQQRMPDIPEPDYTEVDNPTNPILDGSANLYENGLILNSIRNPENPDRDRAARFVSTTSTSDSLNTEIDEVANELIRISEEQENLQGK